MKRFRFKRDKTVSYPLIKEARLAREKAEQLPPGEEREGLRVGGDIREFRKLFPGEPSRSLPMPLPQSSRRDLHWPDRYSYIPADQAGPTTGLSGLAILTAATRSSLACKTVASVGGPLHLVRSRT